MITVMSSFVYPAATCRAAASSGGSDTGTPAEQGVT
jgi:hypothetical protein